MTLSFIDLFCGAGGWTTGLKRAGLTHRVGVDVDAHALKTYRANHTHAICKSVADVTLADLAPFLPADVIFASPPCQTFSLIGRRAVGHPNDGLFAHAVRLASAARARAIVFENVVGMLSKRGADGGRIFDRMLADLANAGFAHVQWAVLDAQDYGVPQGRRRVVVVAAREAVASAFPPPPAPLPPTERVLGRFLLPHERVTDPIYWMTPTKIAYFDQRAATHKGRVRYVDPDAVARTVRAGYFKSRGAEALVRVAPDRVRMLTEDELAAVQSFPSDYTWVGAHIRVYTQIGNAVPPTLAFHVGRWISQALHPQHHPQGGDGGKEIEAHQQDNVWEHVHKSPA
jgi:DNA (cytosine-5)-methyltransferase 1